MVDSLPPSGIDPDSETIISNSNGKLSVALDGLTLDVGSSGKVQVFETRPYLGNFDQDSGDWTEIDSVSNGIAKVDVADGEWRSPSVTADLTGINKLNFRFSSSVGLDIFFDGTEEYSTGATEGFRRVEISGLDSYGADTEVMIQVNAAYHGDDPGTLWIDYVRSDPIQPQSRKIELVDIGDG